MSWQEANQKIIDEAKQNIAAKKSKNDLENEAYEDLYNDETLQTYQTVQLLIKNGWTAKDFKDNGIDVTILKVPRTTIPASLTRYYMNDSSSQYGGNINESYSGEVAIALAFTAAELKEAGYTDAEIKEAASDTKSLSFYTNKTTHVESTKKCFLCSLKF